MIKNIVLSISILGAGLSPLLSKSAIIGFIKGKAKVKLSKKWQKAKVGMKLRKGSQIKTSKNSTVLIIFKRGTRIKLRALSHINLDKLSGSENITIGLRSGGIFSKVKKRRSGEHFKIKTPTTVAGVRGTQFFMAYGAKKKDNLWLCVNEGLVRVKSGKNQVDVPEGKGVAIIDSKVSNPTVQEWTKGLNWNMDEHKGKIEDKTTIDEGKYDLLNQDYD